MSVPHTPISRTRSSACDAVGTGSPICASLMLFLTPGVTVRARMLIELDFILPWILPGVLDDPDRLCGVEVFLALDLVLVENLLVHIHPDPRLVRNRTVATLDLWFAVYQLSLPFWEAIIEGLLDQEIRDRCIQLDRCRVLDRTEGVVECHLNPVRLSYGADLSSLRNSANVSEINLEEVC